MRLAFLLALSGLGVLLSHSVRAQTLDEQIAAADVESYLSLPEPPLGMTLRKTPIVVEDTFVGFWVRLSREDGSGVTVMVELRDISQEIDRRASLKAYFEGGISGLKKGGMQPDLSGLPDFDKVDLKKPIDLEYTATGETGHKYLVWQRIFFTSKGFDISLIGIDRQEYNHLVAWAKKIRPVVVR